MNYELFEYTVGAFELNQLMLPIFYEDIQTQKRNLFELTVAITAPTKKSIGN
jgi:uncharacterized protein YutD